MKLYPCLLSIVISFTCLQTYADVIVTSNLDNPNGPIAGETTLRDAINTINGGGGGEIIAFAPNVTTIYLLEPLPAITEQVTIDGLAQVMGTEITPGNCDTLPSPVDNPEVFSHLLRVTIDGSNITLSLNLAGPVGLFFRSTSNNSVVRGIRIQNIFGDNEESVIGILSDNTSDNITTECCMVDNMLSKNASLSTSKTTGLENISTISKCYIRNIKSLPLNFDPQNDSTTTTAPASGILNPRLVQGTRIECVSSGDIVSKLEEQFPILELTIGSAHGITNLGGPEKKIAQSKDCLVGSGSNDEKIVINNCHISHIMGGSIDVLISPQQVSLDRVAGIYLSEELETYIEDCYICDVQTGSACIPNTAESLTSNGLFGISVRPQENNTCIQYNTVKAITHGPIEMGGKNNIAELTPAVGIFARALPLVVENNSVSDIFGGCHITTGECSTIVDQTTFGNPWGTSGIVALLEISAARKTTKTGSACPSPDNNFDELIVLCNNQINNISGGTRIADEEGAEVSSFGSLGIASSGSKIVANNNTVTSITGTNLITKAPNAKSILTFGTKGILTSSNMSAEVCNNSVSSIQEGKVSTLLQSIHLSAENTLIFFAFPPLEASLALNPAKTTGILTKADSSLSSLESITANNYVTDITGSQPTGSGIAMASVGIGITISPAEELLEQTLKQNNDEQKKQNKIITQCGSNLLESSITKNTIAAITSHLTRPAYGIFSEQLQDTWSLTVADNTINTICGGGAALTQSITKNIPDISLSLCDQLAGSMIITDELLLIPSLLPYEPTSGIYLLQSDCTTVHNNSIEIVGKIEGYARGITSTASNDIEIFENSISKIKSPGIFVGGAPLLPSVGSDIPLPLNLVSPSVRNIIYNNKTFKNTGKGIELGLSDWGNAFELIPLFLGSEEVPSTRRTILGNHNQPAPKITRIVCNTRKTVTIDVCLNDPRHPDSDFIIQFFANNTNGVPHGQTPITDFDGSEFIMTTNENGTAYQTFTFMPLASLETSNNITAHVTLIRDGSEDIGDTSEFGVEIKPHNILGPLTQTPKPFMFNQFLCK